MIAPSLTRPESTRCNDRAYRPCRSQVEFGLMTTKERLHKLVDQLSEREADEALRLIASRRGGDFASWLDAAPVEDEQISEDEESAVQEAREEIATGTPLLSADEIKREFQYSSE
jgi:hypothetical protein